MNAFGALLFLSLGLLSPDGAAASTLKVTASFSIIGDMISRVGGNLVTVTTIVGPNSDTHVYEPKPADASNLAATQVFFVNGLGFEGWMERLVEATSFKGKLVVLSAGIEPRKMTEEGKEVVDPHAWQNLSNGLVYVKNIAAALCEADAGNCADFQKNAQIYSAEITALDATVRDQIKSVPKDQRKVITTHDAFGYFGAAYGVSFLAPEGMNTESEASAADVAKLIDQVKQEKAKALFIENMSDPRLIEQIAAEAGVKPGGALFSDALSEKGQGGETYLAMFQHNISLLVPAMKGQ